MLISARRGISYPNPDRSDRPDIPAHILNLINALEIDMIYKQGTDAARIASAHLAGTLWWTTDTGHFWYDDGAAWHQIDAAAAAVNLSGTYAARPAANTVAAGVVYFATDTLGQWRSDGAAWTLIDQGIPLIAPSALSTLPGPYDGQLVALQVDATNGINWTFRYNAGSVSAYKWEAIGPNPPLYAEVTTQESTTTTASYVALTTAGPSVTLPRNGDYDVEVGNGSGQGTVSGQSPQHSYDIGGTGAVDADSTIGTPADSGGATHYSSVMRRRRKTGLTSGIALVSKYKSGAGTSLFQNRWMAVYPVRIN